jgi:hypothetical protein
MLALKEAVFGAGLLSQALGIVNQGMGLLLGEGHDVAPSALEELVDEAFEGWPVGEGQEAGEADSVKTGEHGDDPVGRFGEEARQRFRGVLLWDAATPNPILAGECRFCSYFLVAALPR